MFWFSPVSQHYSCGQQRTVWNYLKSLVLMEFWPDCSQQRPSDWVVRALTFSIDQELFIHYVLLKYYLKFIFKKYLSLSQSHHWRFFNFELQELWSCLQKLQTKSFFVLLWTDSENWSQENCQKITIYQNIKHQQWLTEWRMNNTDCGLAELRGYCKILSKSIQISWKYFQDLHHFFPLHLAFSIDRPCSERKSEEKIEIYLILAYDWNFQIQSFLCHFIFGSGK